MNQRCYRDGSEHRAASGDGQSGDSQVGADSSWFERQKGKKRNRPSERYQRRRKGPSWEIQVEYLVGQEVRVRVALLPEVRAGPWEERSWRLQGYT